MTKRIAFQGEPGAYSHQACRDTYPDMTPMACRTFEDAIETVRAGEAELAMLPVENSTFGRVADIHHLLPSSDLHIVAEAFVRVHINLLALPGVPLEQIERAMSHTMLLGQCREFLTRHGIHRVTGADTAGSAREVAQMGDPKLGALASELAGEIYGLDVLARHIEDERNNTTRFLVMSREPDRSRRGDEGMMTTFVFQVRNIPAALYKAMGGFATNGVNMTKLESYMVGGSFTATQFYADIEGHPEDPPVKRALDELEYFTSKLEILGVYPADPRRH
ncbi:prephenate dehydratase [Roseovarius aestuariivivens]|uniref:prephenate dehydratase n=1 Tax=Roseovarius aestuariivivens TaxID=1888910 RepID=UPI00108140A1|nr:prephenate dehydratase [Roseovarius aestuariivivens]